MAAVLLLMWMVHSYFDEEKNNSIQIRFLALPISVILLSWSMIEVSILT
jgi:hypothetical protein